MPPRRFFIALLLFPVLLASALWLPQSIEATVKSQSSLYSAASKVLTGSADSNRFSGVHLIKASLENLELATKDRNTGNGAKPFFSRSFAGIGLLSDETLDFRSPFLRLHLLHRILLI